MSSSVSSSSKSSSSSSSSSANTDCTSAQPGYYIDGAKCSPCQAGYYCPGGNVRPIICPIGYYCPAVSITATICPAARTTKTEGAKDISECIAIAQVAAVPTPRSGGNQIVILITMLLGLGITTFVFYGSTKRGKLQEWKKL